MLNVCVISKALMRFLCATVRVMALKLTVF